MAEVADVLIIGAGAAGLGAAAHLADFANVIVLEAEDTACHHSTGRSAALYLKSYGPPGVLAATGAGEAFFTLPPEGFADAPLLSPRGMLHLDYQGGKLAGLMDIAPGIERITPAEAAEMVPILRPELIRETGYEDDARDIDVDLLTTGFQRMMRAGSARLVTRARVSALRREGSVWRAETPAGVFEAPIVVNAAGAWGSVVAKMAEAAPIHIQPKRRSAAIVPVPEPHDPTAWPGFVELTETWYAKPMGGKLMVSPADAEPVEPFDAWPDDMTLAEGVDRFSQAVNFEVTRVERSWAGLRSFSPDGEPVVGFDLQQEGFFWLAGQGGYGIQTAPALSRLAADLILKREPLLDAAVFSPARFG